MNIENYCYIYDDYLDYLELVLSVLLTKPSLGTGLSCDYFR